MTAIERANAIQHHLFSYQSYKQTYEEYVSRAMRQTQKMTETGIHGSHKSDPTARGAVMLADLPEQIKTKVLWIGAIEDAWAECIKEDCGKECGLAYVMEHYFCLTGERREKKHNGEAVRAICEECEITPVGFRTRRGKIIGIVQYHAALRKLI